VQVVVVVEQNQPVDVGKEQIQPYKKAIDGILTEKFQLHGKSNLPELIRQIDEEEPHIMSDLERTTYLALRDGMQIFKTISSQLSDKSGLRKKLASAPITELDSPEIHKLKDFCYNFAAYAASLYVSKKLDQAIAAQIDVEAKEEDKTYLSQLRLDTTRPEEGVIFQLLAPVYTRLVEHLDHDREILKSPYAFPIFVKEVFEKYAELAKEKKDRYPSLEKEHINGYRFRIMDDFLAIEGYEDKSIPTVKPMEQKITFRPIDPNEIVGNLSSKRKITRTVERLVLYDFTKQKNPILELGGLPWSTLLDGLPGTGKSSMFRMAMTLLHEYCQQLGLKYYVFTVDPSIKDEYYGKTGKILLERLSVTKDPNALSLGIFDDLDLLTTTRRDAQGADNDINNIIMQYFDGVFTQRLGNVTNYGATNKPTGLDNAMRNRFNDRMLVDGPTTSYDFADLLMLECKDLVTNKLLRIEHGKGYKPFTTQDFRRADGTWTAQDVVSYMADEFVKYKKASILDFGEFMEKLKEKNPSITGRSAKAIIESIHERCADFNIPREWFSNKAKFFDLPYARKVQKLSELYNPITPEILFQEAQRYADSEQRYAQKETEEEVGIGYKSRIWNLQAEIQFLEEQLGEGISSDYGKLIMLKSILQDRMDEGLKTIKEAYEKAEKTDKSKK